MTPMFMKAYFIFDLFIGLLTFINTVWGGRAESQPKAGRPLAENPLYNL